MAAIRIYRRLQDLQDVDPNGLPQSGVPRYHTDVSSFVVETIAGGAGGSFSLGASTIGNTLGDTGVTGSRVVLAATGNLTLSQATDVNGGTILISAGTQSAAAFSAGISGGNTSGQTGLTGTHLALAGGNAITLSGATDAGGGTVTISAPGTSVLSAVAPLSTSTNGQTISILGPDVVDLSISGNTAGVPALVSTGTLTLAGGSNITLSQNGNAISIIAGATAAETQTAISGIANSQTTYTSGTVRFSELGAVTIRSTTGNQFQISVNSQSVQPETQTFVGGIAASNTTYTSGTVTITGSGIVTVQSGTGQRIIINASQSVQAETQTFIGGIIASDTTYTSGSVRLTGVGGGVTVSSNTGQRVDISVAAPVAQTGTQFSAGLTNSGNTSGDTGTVGGRLLLVGTNNITMSGSTNGQSMTITVSGPSVAGAQTGISGIANSQTTYTSGTVSLSELGAITIRSTTGNQFQLSVNAQTVESQSIGMSNLGNTSGTTGIASGGQVRFLFAGAGEVTLSQSLNGASGTLTISSPAQTVESQSIGMSNVGNTSGTTGVASGGQVRFVFAGGNNVTLSQSLNGASGTITISAASQSVQAETQTFIGGIANTETTYTSGTVKFLELGAITVRSTTGNQFQLSVNSQTVQTQSLFSAGVSTGGNTAGDTGVTGTRMVFVGSQNITLSQATAAAGGTITIQGPVTAAQTADSGGVYAVGNTYSSSSGTFDVRTLSIRGDGIISVAATNSGWRISASQSVQPETQTFVGGIAASNTTYTSGTITITGVGGGVTVSSNTGQRVDISVAAQTGTQFSAGLSNLGNTAGDTVTVGGRLILAGSNGITLSGSSNGASQTITISGITQSVESQSIGASNLGNTLGTSGVASGGQVRMVIIGTSNITVSQSLNGASGTMSLIGQPSFSAGVSTGGNTGGATGVTGTRMVLIGSNNITLSQTTDASGGTVSIFGPSPGAAQYSIGVSTGGNTAGSTGVTGTRIVFVGTGNLSLSQSTDATGATISINNTVSAGSIGVSTDGNTAGATGVTGTRYVLVGSSPISLSQTTGANGGTVTINAPATSSLSGASGISISTNGSTISVFPSPRTSFNAFDEVVTMTGNQGQGSLHIQPIHAPHVQYDRILLSYQISNASNSSGSFTLSNWVGIYTKNVSTLSLVSSISTSTNFSGSGTVGSYSLYGGLRQLSMPWTMTLSDGDYWVGIVNRTTSGGAAGHTINQILKSGATISSNVTGWSGLLGAASAATAQQQAGLGTYSVSTAGIPNTIGFSEITGSGTLPLQVPLFHFRSGTV